MEPSTLGREGERLARQYLERKGYIYLTSNFKRAHGEIDLIMKDGSTLVFIEVKTRRNRDMENRWNPSVSRSRDI